MVAAEVLVPAQETPKFDVMCDVPAQMWEGVNAKVETFLASPRSAGLVEHLANLAQVNPAVRDQLRQRAEVVAALKREGHRLWASVDTTDTRQAKSALEVMGDVLSILPEFRDELEPIADGQVNAVLSFVQAEINSGKNAGVAFRVPVPFDFFATTLISLMRLLPKQRQLVRYFLDDREFKRVMDTRIGEELAAGPEWNSFLVLAEASLLYPEHAQQYKEKAAAYWGAVKQEIATSGPKSNIFIQPSDVVWAAHLLGADRAYIDSNGDLKIEQTQQLEKAAELPTRLMA